MKILLPPEGGSAVNNGRKYFMRVTLKRDGGDFPVPGLNHPVTLDTDTLPADKASKLEGLVAATHFFALPAVVGTPKVGAVGYFTYQITVDEGHQCHTVELSDFTEEPALVALRDYLQE